MTDKPWAERMADRMLTTEPDAIEEEMPVDRSVSRPPAPQWAQRLAERATTKPDTDQPAA